MASEDVIELGSSEDESEPAPKKSKKCSTPMVYIPNNLHELTIKPAKSKTNVNTSQKSVKTQSNCKSQIKPIPVINKVHSQAVLNPYGIASKAKSNGIEVRRIIPLKPTRFISPTPLKPTAKTSVNPIRIMAISPQMQVAKRQTYNTIRCITPHNLNKLNPEITITKTNKCVTGILKVKKNVPNKRIPQVKHKTPTITNVSQLLTVELDDEAQPSTAASGPQWYLRPEDQSTNNTKKEQQTDAEINDSDKEMEELNNKEPNDNFIEITIEDSPIKTSNKRKDEVGAEFAITIEDSPSKPRDVESTSNKSIHKSDDKQSKKQLLYSQTSHKSIEIEIEPISNENRDDDEECELPSNKTHVIEIDASPAKEDNFQVSTPKKNKVNQQKSQLLQDDKTTEKEKFHPIYQEFIDLCLELENSSDMHKIVEKKIKSYYNQVPTIYTESEIFLEMISSKVAAIKACPEKMYMYIKDVVDELNLQRKIAKAQLAEKKHEVTEQEKFLYGEESEFDSVKQRQIRKLEKTIKKLHRAIQKLEEQEVDFDDEDDSVYLLTERYKERMVRVHAKLCQLTNTKMPSEPRVQIDPRPGQPKGPAKRLEKWINKKVPIGTPLPFPDFHDVLRCVREANQEENLGWNEADIMEEARDLFTRCGKKLQRRRQENEWRLAASRINAEVDPASVDEDLKKKLEANSRVAARKEIDVFNKYADRQNQLNLEAVEIGDKEADESPVESDEEEPVEESTSLANKELRKERIKRLIQEKSGKVSKKSKDIEHKSNTEISDAKALESQETDTKLDNDGSKEEQCDKADPEKTAEDNQNSDDENKIHSLSDSDRIDSDIDELHLLQKLGSSKEYESSTQNTSDSESPIAISDTLSSDDGKKQSKDVFSIENSSFSESEEQKSTDNFLHNNDTEKNTPQDNKLHTITEIYSTTCSDERNSSHTNKNVINEFIEDILLASSEDDAEKLDNNEQHLETNNVDSAGHIDNIEQDAQDCETNTANDDANNSSTTDFVNLRDDNVSITDTFVETACEDIVDSNNDPTVKMSTIAPEETDIATVTEERAEKSIELSENNERHDNDKLHLENKQHDAENSVEGNSVSVEPMDVDT